VAFVDDVHKNCTGEIVRIIELLSGACLVNAPRVGIIVMVGVDVGVLVGVSVGVLVGVLVTDGGIGGGVIYREVIGL